MSGFNLSACDALVPKRRKEEFYPIRNEYARHRNNLLDRLTHFEAQIQRSTCLSEKEKRVSLSVGQNSSISNVVDAAIEIERFVREDVIQLDPTTIQTTLQEAKGMEKGLQLVTSEMFGAVQCDFYKDGDNVYMTGEQLGMALDYAEPRKAINKIVERNPRLATTGFSTDVKLTSVEGGREVSRETRVFTEDGIYEVSMLAKTEKAETFRDFVRHILKALRRGDAVVAIAPPEDTFMMHAKTVRESAEFVVKTIGIYGQWMKGETVELYIAKAMEMVTAHSLAPQPPRNVPTRQRRLAQWRALTA